MWQSWNAQGHWASLLAMASLMPAMGRSLRGWLPLCHGCSSQAVSVAWMVSEAASMFFSSLRRRMRCRTSSPLVRPILIETPEDSLATLVDSLRAAGEGDVMGGTLLL